MAQVSIDPATDSLSYWHATTEPLVPSPALPEQSEVVVVGGGLLGCWTAYWLAKAGVDVVLVERTAIGWGATGRNGGFLVGGTAMSYSSLVATVGRDAARRLQQLTIDGQELAHTVVAEEEIDCDLRRTGTLSLALESGILASMEQSSDLLNEDGFEGEILDRHQVQEAIDSPLGAEIVGGSLAPAGGVLHSTRYLAGIARAAERLGARLVRANVTSLSPHGTGTRIATTGGDIDAQRVVIALNAWSDTLVPALAGLVVPARGQILAYAPVAPVFHTAVGAGVTATGEYWHQAPDGTIIIGGCRADAPGADLGVREMVATPDVTTRIEGVLPRLFPELASLRVARRWAGLMAFTSDHLPVADAVPGMPGVWVTGGFCGHGMAFGPRIGQLLALAVQDSTPPAALTPMRIDRPTLHPLVPATA